MNINVSGNYTLELTPEAFLTQTANIYLQCKTTDAPVVITLPRITSVGGVTTTWGFKIYVNDVDNNASVNNITLTPHPADKINGTLSTPVVLNTNGVTGNLQITGTNSWEFSTASTINPSIDGAIKTFLVPLTVSMFNDVASTSKSIAVGRLPFGYRYLGAVLINTELWTGGDATSVLLSIDDTVSATALVDTFVNLLTAPPEAQSLGGKPNAVTITLDSEGLEGITIAIVCDINLDQLTTGSSSLYIISNQIPSNPDGLLPVLS